MDIFSAPAIAPRVPRAGHRGLALSSSGHRRPNLGPFAGIAQILDAAQEAKLTTLGLHRLMASTAAEDGTTPADWLAAGKQDDVIKLVAAANAHGS